MSDLTGIITNVTTGLPFQVEHYGPWVYLLIFLSILVASSFIITPFPGNSLLFVSGALATTRQLDLIWLLGTAIAAAYIGYDINYWSGRLLGIAVCRQGCPAVFEEKNTKKALEIMKRYGNVSIIVSRFVPALNLPPFFAGMDVMDYRLYIGLNLAGAVVWSGLVLSIGYLSGGIPVIQAILPVLVVIIIVILGTTLAAAAIVFIRAHHARKMSSG